MLMCKLKALKLGPISLNNLKYGNQLPISTCACKTNDHKTYFLLGQLAPRYFCHQGIIELINTEIKLCVILITV